MLATALATVAALEVVMLCKYDKALLRVVIVFRAYLSLVLFHVLDY